MNRIKLFIKRLLGIDIIKVFSINALATLVRMLAGLVSVKVVSVIIGPAGIALVGQLNNFNSILLGVANGGITNGITKYVAEYKDDENRIKDYLSSGLKITLICSSIVSLFLIIASSQLSRIILMSSDYYYVFIVFGFSIGFYALNVFLISVLNGYKAFKEYATLNILGTLVGLIYTVPIVYYFGLAGALIHTVTYQSLVFFVTFWGCRKMIWMKVSYFKEKMKRPIVKSYLGFSLMAITTLTLGPLSQIIVRSHVITTYTATDAGIWEGMNRLSTMYLSVITTSFAIYYLPRLSEISDDYILKKEIFRCYKIFIPLAVSICAFIYLFRYIIIKIVFTEEFLSMSDLFSWQLAGDVLRIGGWLLSYLMVAKAKTKAYILMEFLSFSLYIIFCYFFLKLNGVVGLSQGYFCNCFVFLIVLLFLFRKLLLNKNYPV